MRRPRSFLSAACPLLLAFACLAQACAGPQAAAAPPRHDEPVPANEPRAALKVRIDLAKTATCEESFDVALYAGRGVDLVDWAGPFGKCAGRTATIRYLPKRITKEQLLESIRKLSTKVEILAQ